MLPISAAAERNKRPIERALQELIPNPSQVLEIGSGTGQHAVHFCKHLPHLTWHPTEIHDNTEILLAHIAAESLPNLHFPKNLDVTVQPWPIKAFFDVVFTANTLHIIHKEAVEALISGSSRALNPGGLLIVYGPFNCDGQFTSQGNAQFDAILREQNPASGIRDQEWIIQLCSASELALQQNLSMPANNRLLVFRKSS